MNVVVTGGGTIAPIDDVRVIANASTGRFSAAITEACLERGAIVWHVHAPSAQLPIRRHLDAMDLDDDPAVLHARLDQVARRWREHRDRLHRIPLPRGTVADTIAVLSSTLRSHSIDLVFLAMAVSDYEPSPTTGKIASGPDELLIRCRKTPKVIRSVRDWAPDAYAVGFKLLSGATESDLIASARESCRVNRVDLTVANDLRSYRDGRHTIHLVRPDEPVETIEAEINDLAGRLVDRVVTWTVQRPSGRAGL